MRSVAPSPYFHLPLAVIGLLSSFGGGVTGRKVFGSSRRWWQWEDMRCRVLSQVKTKTAGGGITSIAEAKLSDRMVPEFVAVFQHSQYEESHIVSRQFRKIILRNYAEGGYQDRITRYYVALPLF